MNPTAEQANAVRLFRTGEPLVIEAGAGTGKTSTLKLLAESEPGKRMQYVAFNKAIVEESRAKFPSNVTCSTIHSLAMKAVGTRYRHRLNSNRLKSQEIARRLDVREINITVGEQTKRMAGGFLASHVMAGIRSFCQSADLEPTPRHLPYIEGIDLPTEDGRRTFGNNNEIGKYLADALTRAWADLQSIDGVLPFGHECYLKMWERSEPRIYADVVLFDEAQDASPVMASIIGQQTQAQRVYVGDSQQQLYAWLGAVNALGSIEGANRAFLTKSFRFGPEIARTANLVLDWLDAELRITGNEAMTSTTARLGDTPNAILCRANATAVATCLRLMAEGKRVHLVGGAREIVDFAKGAADLQNGKHSYHRDLSCFDSWSEVQLYVQNDPQGSDLKLMVKLVDDFGASTIIRALGDTVPEARADMIVSTAHKSKGREWATVQLAGDFPEETTDPGELRLLYVACTRARQTLDHYAAPMFFDALPKAVASA